MAIPLYATRYEIDYDDVVIVPRATTGAIPHLIERNTVNCHNNETQMIVLGFVYIYSLALLAGGCCFPYWNWVNPLLLAGFPQIHLP
jgi:hypothetical protein